MIQVGGVARNVTHHIETLSSIAVKLVELACVMTVVMNVANLMHDAFHVKTIKTNILLIATTIRTILFVLVVNQKNHNFRCVMLVNLIYQMEVECVIVAKRLA